jgi:hypothetical protein
MELHPAIRLVVLLVLAAALPALSLALLVLIALALLAAHFLRGGMTALRQLGYGLWRLRWLFLAIVFLYLGFTQGEPLTPVLPGLAREGVLEGLRRSLVLADLLAAVYLLVLMTPLPSLVGGLLWLLMPLRWLRLDPDRFALRIGLVLEQVQSGSVGLRRGTTTGGDRNSLLEALARRIEEAEFGAATAARDRMPVIRMSAPDMWQWLLPIVLAVALYGIPL